MLYHDKIDVSEGTDNNETSASKNVLIVTIGIFKFRFPSFACNSCHDV